MATRRLPAAAPHPAHLSSAQMNEALPRLAKRLKDLEYFTADGSLDEVSAAANALKQKYDDTLIEIFGNDTLEYQRYRIATPVPARRGNRRN